MWQNRSLKLLILDTKGTAADSITESLKIHNVPLEEFSTVRSAHKAVLEFSEGSFDHCYLDSSCSENELVDFFSDLKSILANSSCLFFLFQEDTPPTSPEAIKNFIHGCISLKGTAADFQTIENAERQYGPHSILNNKKRTVQYAADKLLDVVDRAAGDVKRDAHRGIQTALSNVIKHETDYSKEVLEQYLESLVAKSSERIPNTTAPIVVPERILKKNLPKLRDDTYSGASQRVWKKLQEHFNEASVSVATDTDEELQAEETKKSLNRE